MDENHVCLCHGKHERAIVDLDKNIEEVKGEIKLIKDLADGKISTKTLFVFIPLFVLWMGFQVALYNMGKDTQSDMKVIKKDMRHYSDALTQHLEWSEKQLLILDQRYLRKDRYLQDRRQIREGKDF